MSNSNAKTPDNVIYLSAMDSPEIVGEFLVAARNLIEHRGLREITIDCKNFSKTYPNILAPLAGIIEFYKSKGIQFTFCHLGPELEKSCFNTPLSVGDNHEKMAKGALNIVWKYQSDNDTNILSRELLRSISEEIICEEGVIDALLWCMNEVMDNVIVHSNVSLGFVMGKIHKQSKRIAICVYDHGQGIYNSLKDSTHVPKFPLEAIQLAIQERVTRDKKIGQGNGLWGLSEIVKNNAGRLTVISQSGMYRRSNGDVEAHDNAPFLSSVNGGCLVDFQLIYSRKISLTAALKGHKPVNYRTESFEDDSGFIVYRLIESKSGTGTRASGKKIRTDLINLFLETGKGIVIDFDGLSVVSSSFADELVGKILVHFGFAGFNRIVRLKNMTPVIEAIVQRSVAQRMAEAFT